MTLSLEKANIFRYFRFAFKTMFLLSSQSSLTKTPEQKDYSLKRVHHPAVHKIILPL